MTAAKPWSPPSVPRVRWVLTRAAFVTGVASNLGFALGVVGPSIRADLELNRAALGLLTSVFFACTGIASVAAGHLVARSGSRGTAAGAALLTCFGCVGAAALGSYPGLICACVVAGSGYSVVNVATNRIVRSVATPRQLGRFMAVKTAGVPVITTFIALVGTVTARWGWRPALAVLGVIAALAAALVGARFPAGASGVAKRADRVSLASGFWLLPVAGFCAIAGSQPIYSWFAIYLHESLGVSTGTAALLSGICTATGVPAMICAAGLSDRLGPAHRANFLGGLCLVCAGALTVVLAAHTVGIGSAVVAVAVGAAANLSFAGLFPALIVECAPGALERGTGVAMTGYFFGALLSPVGFGALADTPGGYPLAWASASVVSVVGLGLFVLIGRRVGERRARGTGAVPDPPVVG